jgi:hypothetical protein
MGWGIFGFFFLVVFKIVASAARASETGAMQLFLKSIVFCALTGVFCGYIKGTHSEPGDDDDPIRGRSETVVDYEPTFDQRLESGVRVFLLLATPALAGVLWGCYQRRLLFEKLRDAEKARAAWCATEEGKAWIEQQRTERREQRERNS